jgi:hypothetical protein
MRAIATVIVMALCSIAAARPAVALEELKNCDVIPDAGQRMACMQAHIAHLEETLLSLNTEIVDLKHALKERLAATEVYKLEYVGKSFCLGFAGDNQPPTMQSCDQPDSWKLRLGAQRPGSDTRSAAAPTPGPNDKPGAAATPGPTDKPGAAPKPASSDTKPGAAANAAPSNKKSGGGKKSAKPPDDQPHESVVPKQN